MATQTAWYRATPGQSLFAYPLSKDIADWATYFVPFIEKPDGGGWYSTSLDDSELDWAIFDTVPTSWDESEYASIHLEPSQDASVDAPYYPTVTRNVDDTSPIFFTWESNSSLTVQKSFNGGAFAPATGTASLVRAAGSVYLFQLSYSADDRPSSGVAEYSITDGTDTFYLPLSMNTGAGGGGGGDDAATIYSYFTASGRELAFRADISGLSTFDPDTDTVARVTLVDTTTDLTNGGGGGDSKEDIYTYFTTGGREVPFQADLTGVDDAADIYTYFTDASREDAFKADVSGLSTFDPASDTVARVTLVDTTTDLTNGGGDTKEEIYDYFTTSDRELPFQADLSGVSSSISSILTVSDKHDTMLEGDGLGGWQYTELALENTPTGSGGSGLYQVTVRVQDASLNALQGARVNVAGTVLTLTTPSDGTVVFNLDSGVYTLDCSPPAGYDTPVGNVITVTTSDISSTFTLNKTDPDPGNCTVPRL